MNRRNNKRGFSLAELMLAVAIIIILGALAFVGVTRYLRNLRLLEMDNAAKEMYFAAQNRMTAALVSGDLGRLNSEDYSADTEHPMTATVGGETVTLNVIKVSRKASMNLNETLLDEILPFGSIDETIRAGGSYIITYTMDPKNNLADVWDVWYTSDDNSGFFRNWSGSEYALLNATNDQLAAARIDQENGKDNRLHFRNGGVDAVIGHYGSSGISIERRKLDVTLELVNDEVLYLTGKLTVDDKPDEKIPSDVKPQVNLIVEGLSSGATKLMTPDKSHITIDEDGNFYFVLDDVTTENKRFRDQFDHDDEDTSKLFIPGEDIRVTVEVYSNETLANIDRATAVDNSLFQYVKSEKATGKTIAEVGIGKIRHLQNLSSEVSKVELGVKKSDADVRLGINTVRQNDDLDWSQFAGKEIKKGTTVLTTISGNIYYNEGNGTAVSHTTASFLPIDLELKTADGTADGFAKQFGTTEVEGEKPIVRSFLYYDAEYTDANTSTQKRHKISNLKVEGVDNAGLFGSVGTASSATPPETTDLKTYLLTVKNLEMPEARITGNATAGTVVADVQRAARITGVSVSEAEVAIAKGKTGDVGGVVGKSSNGLDIFDTSVTESVVNKVGESGNGNAGGLLGSHSGSGVHLAINNCSVTNKTIDKPVTGTEAAGGLVGSITNGIPTITNSYSTAIVSGNVAGGLVGTVAACGTGSEIKSCYVGGHVIDGTNGRPVYSKDNYNVTGANVAGGFIGSSDSANLSINNCYTTASAWATAANGVAGGFYGNGEGITILGSYATGLVKGNTAGAFSGTYSVNGSLGSATTYTDANMNFYFELINEGMPGVVVPTEETPQPVGIMSVETSTDSYNAFFMLRDPGTFFPYNGTLKQWFKSDVVENGEVQYRYFLPTAKDLDSANTDAPTTHVGDWQPVDTLVFNTAS